jgi:hypothetical protein
MVMTGGEGRPSVSFGDLFDILFGENDISDDRSNKIAGLDLRLNLPGWQFYLEFAGEDEAGGAPSKMAGLAGFYFPRLTGNMDLRLEYVDFAYTEELAGVWYRHGTYSDGYTYEGRTLGHHAGGGGSRDLFTELTFDLGEKAKGSLGIDLEERGIHLQPEVERHTQLSAGLERIFTLAGIDTKIGLTVAVDQVDNWNYIPGEEATDYYLSMKVGVDM